MYYYYYYFYYILLLNYYCLLFLLLYIMFIIIIIVIIIVISIIIIIMLLMLMLMLMLKMLIIKAEDHKAGAGDILHIHLMILHRLVPCFITIHFSNLFNSHMQPLKIIQTKKTWWKQLCTFRMITG